MRVYRSASRSRDGGGGGGGASAADLELLRREFRFVRDEDEDAERGETDWRVRMSVRYYRKLFREYALADLSRYEEGRLGLRWRTEMEVVAGKGQFSCGNKRCDAADGLRSYEVLFAYLEQGERKRCLVKLRVCPACARKLFFKKLQQRGEEQEKQQRKRRREEGTKQRSSKRHTRRASDSDGSDAGSESEEPEEDVHQLCTTINEQETRRIKAQLTAEEKAAKGDHESDGGDAGELARLLP
jgi:protein FRA10AC1